MPWNRNALAAMVALAAISPTHAASQDVPAAPDRDGPEIVVTGAGEADKEIRDFVSEIGRETSTDQLARWEGPVCPYVTGLRDAHNRYIADTITAVADAVGAQAGGEGCDVNLVVIVNADPNALIGGLRTRLPLLFESLNPPERRQLIEGDAPVRVWSAVEIRGSDGRQLQRIPPEPPYYQSLSILAGVVPSRILRSTRVDLATTFIVLDAARVEGLSLQQISGFVSMLALAQLETRRAIEPDRSILNLFHHAEAPPDDLSEWDIAYLRALYATDSRRSAAEQRGQIGHRMIEQLSATGAED